MNLILQQAAALREKLTVCGLKAPAHVHWLPSSAAQGMADFKIGALQQLALSVSIDYVLTTGKALAWL